MSASKAECLKSPFRIKGPDTEASTGPLFTGLGFRWSMNAGLFSASSTKYSSQVQWETQFEHTKQGKQLFPNDSRLI